MGEREGYHYVTDPHLEALPRCFQPLVTFLFHQSGAEATSLSPFIAFLIFFSIRECPLLLPIGSNLQGKIYKKNRGKRDMKRKRKKKLTHSLSCLHFDLYETLFGFQSLQRTREET